jgi:hypothetical protein
MVEVEREKRSPILFIPNPLEEWYDMHEIKGSEVYLRMKKNVWNISRYQRGGLGQPTAIRNRSSIPEPTIRLPSNNHNNHGDHELYSHYGQPPENQLQILMIKMTTESTY